MTPDPASTAPATVVPPPNGMRTFLHVLVNTAFANITTSFLWFALTFWVYLETRSVLYRAITRAQLIAVIRQRLDRLMGGVLLLLAGQLLLSTVSGSEPPSAPIQDTDR